MSNDLNTADLAHFTGSEKFYRHPLVRRVVYTEGAQYVAEHGGAYWLLDKIAAMQLSDLRTQEFQVWKFTVDLQKHTGVINVEDGNGGEIYSEKIEYTDFPLPEI